MEIGKRIKTLREQDVISSIAESENQTVNTTNNDSISDEIIKLKELLEKGIISQDDFEKAKNKVLGI